MTKEVFLSILERHCKSGLSIKKFCRNESYYPATFYYWKNKFCSSGCDVPAVSGDNNRIEDFAPVRFPAPASSTGDNEIMIELPSGIRIHFRGAHESEIALRLISQMYSHV